MGEGGWGAVKESEKSCFICGSENEQSRHSSDVMSVCIELAGLEHSSEAGVIQLQWYRWVCDWEDPCFTALAASLTVLFSVLCCYLQPLKAMIQEETTQCVHLHHRSELRNKQVEKRPNEDRRVPLLCKLSFSCLRLPLFLQHRNKMFPYASTLQIFLLNSAQLSDDGKCA